MIFRKQLIKHDPENGKYGDCTRTALACMLNLEPEQVPHFCEGVVGDSDGGESWKKFNAWLEVNAGVRMFTGAFDMEVRDVLTYMEAANPGIYWLMGCKSKIANHSVVCCGGEVVCDPSPTPCPVDELKRCSDGWVWYTVLVPLSQVRLK